MKLGIVTDSTCDLPQYIVEEYGIEVVPSILIVDGREYPDGGGLGRDEFYKSLPQLKTKATTATPSIGEFARRHQKLFNEGCEHIISIHAAGALTTIVNTARQAAQEFAGRVTVLDSLSLSLGLGFQVLAAAENMDRGLEAALSAIESTRRRLQLFAALDSVEYVRRSGRIPGTIALLGSLLSIKPLIEVSAGQVRAITIVRRSRQANERLAVLLKSAGNLERLAILHTGVEARAREFLNKAMLEVSQSLPRDILMINATPVIGTHIGPNGLGFAAIRKE
jgi:DegV family protein with EDD domain